MNISGKTKVYALFGNPIKHSLSPAMYNYSFNYYNINSIYTAFECKENEVKEAISAIRTLGICGGNVTMPYKEAFAKHMDELSPVAKAIGAVNTFVNENGKLTGYITDGNGVVNDLKEHGRDITRKKIVLIGAGGASSAIMVQLMLNGAKKVCVYNRGEEALKKVRKIADNIPFKVNECEIIFNKLNELEELFEDIKSADILINATPVGMAPKMNGISPIENVDAFHKNLVVYDCVYNPKETRLLSDAAKSGVPKENIIGGKGMLIWQGFEAFKIFTDKDMPVKEIRRDVPELA